MGEHLSYDQVDVGEEYDVSYLRGRPRGQVVVGWRANPENWTPYARATITDKWEASPTSQMYQLTFLNGEMRDRSPDSVKVKDFDKPLAYRAARIVKNQMGPHDLGVTSAIENTDRKTGLFGGRRRRRKTRKQKKRLRKTRRR